MKGPVLRCPVRSTTLLLLSSLSACAGSPDAEDPVATESADPDPDHVSTSEREPQIPSEQEPQGPPEEPAVRIERPDPGLDRVRLTSGEWLFGEIIRLRKDKLVFDSDGLDEVSIDWSDVDEVTSDRPMMLLLEQPLEDVLGNPLDDQEVQAVRIAVDDETVVLTRVDGTRQSLARSEVAAILAGQDEESNYWSGGFTFSFAGRSGNTEQIDSSTRLRVQRETAATRARLDVIATYGEVGDEVVTSNVRGTSEFDVFLSRRLFVRPIGVEYYRDTLQGIDRRITPSAGVGYEIFDGNAFAWDVTAGAGFRITEYTGARPDGSDSDREGTGVVITHLEWEITDDVDFDIDYQVQAGFARSGDINHNLRALLSVNLIGDLDLDVGVQWDRVGVPVPLADGTTPDNEDLRVTVGVGWDF